jgi:hypothetical protein
MKKSIKNLETKAIKQTSQVKGGNNGTESTAEFDWDALELDGYSAAERTSL